MVGIFSGLGLHGSSGECSVFSRLISAVDRFLSLEPQFGHEKYLSTRRNAYSRRKCEVDRQVVEPLRYALCGS